MSFNRTIALYIRKAAGAENPLVTSLVDQTQPNAPQFVGRNKFTLRIYFCDEPASNGQPFTSSQVNVGDAIAVAGRPQNNFNEAALLFFATEFAEVEGDDDNYYYEAALDLNTAQIQADLGSGSTSIKATMDVQVQNADNSQRLTFQFGIIINPPAYRGTEGVPVEGDPVYPLPDEIALLGAANDDTKYLYIGSKARLVPLGTGFKIQTSADGATWTDGPSYTP